MEFTSVNKVFEEAFKKNWERPAISNYQGVTLKFGDVARRMEKLHIMFEECGLQRGDKVALCSRNQANWAVAFLATMTYGAVPVPLLHEFKSSNIHHLVNHSEAKILFVDDGSTDKTWDLIRRLHKWNPMFSGLSLSRNRGHQNALLAGLMTAKDRCDCTISMDADLQDDINAIDGMVDQYLEGCDIVYGVRSARDTDTFFKRFTAEGFYKFMELMGAEVVFNHADYRQVSARVLLEFADFREVNLFLRGIVPQIGYKWTTVTYERAERFAGESKYPLKKMLAFAADGITSFSVKFVHKDNHRCIAHPAHFH